MRDKDNKGELNGKCILQVVRSQIQQLGIIIAQVLLQVSAKKVE
jgi:hypothetical protein